MSVPDQNCNDLRTKKVLVYLQSICGNLCGVLGFGIILYPITSF
jgi:hypothetical protein